MTTNATRQARHRASGKPLSLTLTNPDAIKALARLTKTAGSQRAAIEGALIARDQHLRTAEIESPAG